MHSLIQDLMTTQAVLSFSRKVGQGIGGGIAAFGIGIGGYVAGAATQSSRAIDTIKYITGFGPALSSGSEPRSCSPTR
jgi:glucuronide carrier protein